MALPIVDGRGWCHRILLAWVGCSSHSQGVFPAASRKALISTKE